MAEKILEVAIEQFEAAAKLAQEHWQINPKIIEELKEPAQVHIFPITIRLNSENRVAKKHEGGKYVVFEACRSRHVLKVGPTKGGIRMAPDATPDHAIALSMGMSWKCNMLNLPLGGAKGSIQADTKILPLETQLALMRHYASWLYHEGIYGPDKDVPAPDMYTDSRHMAAFMDEISRLAGYEIPGCVTGKPVCIGGSKGRNKATGWGAYYCFEKYCQIKKITPQTAVIQGFGNAAMPIAELLHKNGIKVLAVSDSGGGILNLQGLNVPKLIKFKKIEKISVINYGGGETITNEELLELPCDVLFLAAKEGQITKENAHKIKAKIINEPANLAIDKDGDEILEDAGRIIQPDTFASAGGVVVSHFESVQDRQTYFWEEKEVADKLSRLMHRTTERFLETKERIKSKGITARMVAQAIAIARIAECIKYRKGIY